MLKKKIKELALEAGFAKVGIAPVRIYKELIPLLEKRGPTPFTKKDTQKRINPFLYLKTAKSAIVCLLPYLKGDDMTVAAYARGGDYHKPVKDRLKHIVNGLKLQGYKLIVDTGGLLDKHLAYLAGLGWFGENNLFYSDDLGSRFYIGSILCELELEPDTPIENKCLHCKRCINACPSGALFEPYKLNPYICISYLTQKESLTKQEKEIPKLGKYRLGCDACQDCCPYNKI
jgi:epoxyqueuosine reductase QueG